MITAFTSILHALNANLNVTDAFPEIAAGLRLLTGCDRSSLTLLDDSRQWFCLVAADPPQEPIGQGIRLRLSDSPAAADILAGRPHLVADLASERDFPVTGLLYAAGYRSRITLPLRGYEGLCGALNLTWRQPNAFATLEVPVLTHIADAVALAMERSRLFEKVRAGGEQLQALSRRLIEVQEEERRHLARELHDEIGQVLTALKFSLDIIGRVPPSAAGLRIGEAQQLVDGLIARVRNLSLDLRPPILDDLGLLPALLWSFERFTLLTHVRVRFDHGGLARRFAPDIETAAYRIVQEALTNVARHAGVTEAAVRIWADPGMLHLQISDAGRGFDPAAGSGTTGGLPGMRERASLPGGRLTVESQPGKGTRIDAEIPI